jgi:hypothetical protein
LKTVIARKQDLLLTLFFKLTSEMESTFILNASELNDDFLESLKKLFAHTRQLQITVTASEDFGLLKKETPAEYIARLEKNLADVKAKKNIVIYTDSELDELIFQKL